MSRTVAQLQEAVKEQEEETRRLEREVSSLEGQINAAKDELEREFKVDTVDAAEKLLAKLVAESDRLTKERDALAKELETILDEHTDPASPTA